MIEMTYIANFLRKVEGFNTRLYIPCNLKSGGTANYYGGANKDNYVPMGASGCTVGVGCDLGQTDAATLSRYGCAADIISIFEPYYKKKKLAAVLALSRRPLTVSEDVAMSLTESVQSGYLATYIVPVYNKQSSTPFSKLPKQAQAVVMSLCYQKGVGGVQRDWPKTWKYLVSHDWRAASDELKNGFTQYKSRRRTEGELLEELL